MRDDERAYDEIEAQIGRSAGHIAFTEFRHETYLTEILTDAAQAVWSSLRSTWTLLEIWNNGTTVWASPEGTEIATVTPEGDFQFQTGVS